MSLTLTVDGERWRRHLRSVADADPGLVPVVKGNGYGFGITRLAQTATWLGVDTIAVGTYHELSAVEQAFAGDLMVLGPWRPTGPVAPESLAPGRVIHTVSRLADLLALLDRQPDARIVLERLTSMRRHGMSAEELRAAGRLLDQRPARLEGVAFHLPLAHGAHLTEVEHLVNDVVAAELPTRTLWISHLTPPELARLRASYADYDVRPRVGTALWLGDPGALRVTATVLDVHEVERGDVFGYRGRTVPKAGHILVVSGGTSHGIGLEAPIGDHSFKARAAAVARGGLDAAGFVRSPFTVDGKPRLFAEPPHMQVSMLFLPHGPRVPAVGEEVAVRVRHTATTFDRVDIS
ncbi:alanine racemase [Nocardioides cynanchi]|uniref:alanine racemase n=1 Tax=Nocardioides cynanchi TaxID=2558918 RepID=UPI001244CB6A|nr:alanine racemase [Nocardioides cynanchi]